jgi:hypothetical protein
MPSTPHAARRLGLSAISRLLAARPFDRAGWEAAAAQDLHVRIGNAATVIGKKDGLAELGRFFSRITSLGTGFCETCRSRETLFAELDVEFQDTEGKARRIPCVLVVRVADAALLDVRLHLDPSPIP